MEWYHDIWRNQEMREVGPSGYGMGLAFGYVLVPLVLLMLAFFAASALYKKIRKGGK